MTELARYAVLGHPVEHSRSPFIHQQFAQQTGQTLRYERIECALDGFAAAVKRFADQGGRGCNVTLPFKFEVPQLAQRLTERARLAGAANVLRFDELGWWADNSDGVGLLRDIELSAGRVLAGQRVLLVGAGGAAAGVLGPLLGARPASLCLLNRSVDKAQALVHRHAEWAALHGVQLQAGGLEDAAAHAPFDIVINASASSLQGAASPVPASVLREGSLALDLMYGPAARPWLDWAAAQGAVARDGLGMLVEQAAEAFFHWRRVMPRTAPVLQALRQALAAEA